MYVLRFRVAHLRRVMRSLQYISLVTYCNSNSVIFIRLCRYNARAQALRSVTASAEEVPCHQPNKCTKPPIGYMNWHMTFTLQQ